LWQFKANKPKVAGALFYLSANVLHLLILSTVFHTFSKMKHKKYTLKNESLYPVCKFPENAPFLQSLVGGFLFCLFLGTFAKFRKAAVSFVMSVCLSARNYSAPTGQTFVKVDI
jgi:hypothetical protein